MNRRQFIASTAAAAGSAITTANSMQAGFPPLPWIVADSPETLFSRSIAQIESICDELCGWGVDSISFLTLSLHSPRGDMPTSMMQVSPFTSPAIPSSGINWEDGYILHRLNLIYEYFDFPWIKVFEKEHRDSGLFNFSTWGADVNQIAYLDYVKHLIGGRPAVVTYEECEASSGWVTGFLAHMKAGSPNILTALHNYPGKEEQLWGPQVSNPNLDILEMQISNPANAHNVVRAWRARTNKAIAVMEAGPSNKGIEPDGTRDSNMPRWWIDEPKGEGAEIFGTYSGYQNMVNGVSQTDQTLMSWSGWRQWFETLSAKLPQPNAADEWANYE